MVATITTDTRFSRVSLLQTFAGATFSIGIIIAVTDEPTPKHLDIREDKEGNINNPDDLAVMRQIWTSADGFRNAVGGSITPVISDNGFGVYIPLTEHVARGLPHLLDPASDNVWINKQRVEGDQALLSTRTKRSSDGLVTHVERIGKIPGLTSSDGTTQTYNFGEWMATFGGGTDNPPPILTYVYVEEDGVTSSNAKSQPEWKALWALLQSIKASGDDIPANGPDTLADDFDASNPLPGRTFSFTPAGGTAQTFTLGTISFTTIDSSLYPGQSFVSAFSAVVNVTSGAYGPETYTRWLQAQTVTIGAVANSIRPQSGSLQVPVQARDVELPNGLRLSVQDGLIYHNQPDGSHMPIIGNTGKEMFHQTLPLRTGGGWTIQPDPEVTVITVIGSTNSHLYWPNPVNLVSPSQSREIVIQNISTAICTIYDSANTRRLILGPGQWAQWRISRPILGTTARNVLAQVSDRRRHTMIGGMVGNLAQGSYLDFDSGHWFRPIHSPAAAAFNNADGFSVGGAAYSYTQGLAFSAVTNWFGRGSIRLEASGELIYYQSVELKVEDGVSGTLPSGSEARLYRQPGGSGASVLLGTPNTYQEISGSRDVQTITWLYVGPILEDDVIFAGLRYNKTGGLNPGDVDIVSFTRIALLRPDIVINS